MLSSVRRNTSPNTHMLAYIYTHTYFCISTFIQITHTLTTHKAFDDWMLHQEHLQNSQQWDLTGTHVDTVNLCYQKNIYAFHFGLYFILMIQLSEKNGFATKLMRSINKCKYEFHYIRSYICVTEESIRVSCAQQ